MTEIDFAAFDSDNHYYEAPDAFTRHIEPQYAKRGMQWAQINGKTRLLVGGRINRFIPNPTWDPVSKPGALDEYFRGRNPKGADTSDALRRARPSGRPPRVPESRRPPASHGHPGSRGCDLPPTLGVGMEQALLDDLPALTAAFRAFNRWMEEDWGFAYKERIFAAPVHHPGRPGQRGDRAGVGARPRRPLPRHGRWPRAWSTAGRDLPRRSCLRPVLVPGQRVGCHRLLPRREQRLRRLSLRLGRERGDGGVPPEPVPGPDVGQPDAGHLRQPSGPRAVRPVPQPAPRLHRDRRRMGVPPLREVEEVLRPVAAPVPRGSPGDLQATRVGVALLRGRTGRAADSSGRGPHPHGIGLPARRGPGRPGQLHQGPQELRLPRRGLPARHAGQRDRPFRSAARRDGRRTRRKDRPDGHASRHRSHRHHDRLRLGGHEGDVCLHHPPDQGPAVERGVRLPGRVHVQAGAREGHRDRRPDFVHAERNGPVGRRTRPGRRRGRGRARGPGRQAPPRPLHPLGGLRPQCRHGRHPQADRGSTRPTASGR